MAIVSLVCGIAGFIICPYLGAIAAIITGLMAKSEIKQKGLGGGTMATVGIVLGVAYWVLSILGGIVYAILMFVL